MERNPTDQRFHPGATTATVAELETAIRNAPSPGVILSAPAGPVVAANEAARHLLGLRADRGAATAPFVGEPCETLCRAARDSLQTGRAAWFPVGGDVVETRARRIGDAVVVWLQSSRGALASRLRPSLESALSSAGIGFWEIDLQTDQSLWDAKCFELFGRDPSLGPPSRLELIERAHPEDRERVTRSLVAAMRRGPHTIVFRIQLPSGEIRHLDVRAETVRGVGVRGRRMVGLVFDVTAARAAQAAYRESIDRLAELSLATGVGLWSFELADGRVDWNGQMYALLGRAATLPPLSIAEFVQRIDPADRDGTQQDLFKVIEVGGQLEREVRLRGDDARIRWVRLRARLDRQARGARLVGSCQDVTPLHAALARSVDVAQRLRFAAEAAGLGVWDLDLAAGRGPCNDEMRSLYDLPAEQATLTVHQWLASVHVEDRPRVSMEWRQIVEGMIGERIEFRILRSDGSVREVLARGRVLRDGGQRAERVLRFDQDVSELRAAQRRARSALERLELHRAQTQRVTGAAGVGVVESEQAGERERWDETARRLFGVDADMEASFQHWLDLIHPDDRARCEATARRLIAASEAGSFDYRIVRPDGAERWLNGTFAFERAAGGRVTRGVGFHRDVTASRKVELEREAMRETLHILGETSGLGVWRYHPESRRIECDANFRRIFGLDDSCRDLTVEELVALFHPDDRHRVLVSMQWRGRSPRGEAIEHRVIRADGSQGLVRADYYVHRDGSGRLQHVVGTVLDLAGARRPEVDASVRRLLAALESADLGLFRMNVASGRLEWDARSRALYGAAADDPRPPKEIFAAAVHAEDRARVDDAVRRATAGRGLLDIRYRVLGPNGSIRHLATRADLSGHGEHRELAGVTWEVTELVQAEAARRAQETAERASRAKSEFVAGMSHALRTPLNAILGFAQLLEMDQGNALGDVQRERVERIRSAGAHLLNLVNDVLDLSRIETGAVSVSVEVVELAPLIGEALEMLLPQALARGVQLSSRIGADTPGSVWADRTRLKQVLVNFLGQALRHGRRGGMVTLAADRAATDAARITVRDDGDGLSAAEIEALFQPFNRAARQAAEGEEPGLGLAIAARLVEQMYGTIEVTSTPGLGTEIRVVLREVPGYGRIASARPAPTELHATRDDLQGTVLYIEDNPVNSLLVEHLLHGRPNVRLYRAPDGATGLVLAAACRPDLILVDMRLPDMDGLEVLRGLRAQPETAQVACIAVSAHALPAEIERARAGGFEHYWTKPIDAVAFLDGIDAALGRRR